jgi:hypothetical protein
VEIRKNQKRVSMITKFGVWSGENKLDSMPRDFERAKAEF